MGGGRGICLATSEHRVRMFVCLHKDFQFSCRGCRTQRSLAAKRAQNAVKSHAFDSALAPARVLFRLR